MAYGILIIEDETTLARNIKRYLEKQGYEVRLAETGEAGLIALADFHPDLVLLDVNLPGIDGLETLGRIRAVDDAVKVVLITAHGNVQTAVEAMKIGASDYLAKPLALSALRLLIDRLAGEERVEGVLTYYRDREAPGGGLAAMLGQSPALARLKRRIERLLEAERRLRDGPPPPVLITGETGTGKSLVARALHFDGVRHDRPFVEIDCPSIPAHRLEAALFGHERGAVDNARGHKLGLVEAAHGGTLFLDEVGDLEPGVQAKLLRLIEDGTARRLGGLRGREVDTRVIAATNRPLEAMVHEGRFRADFYYRLRGLHIEVPPLRERDDDCLLLADHFLARHGARHGKPDLAFDAAARDRLRAHSWPGNLRQLRNIVEEAALLAEEVVIGPDALVLGASSPSMMDDGIGGFRVAEGTTLDEIELRVIRRALELVHWNVSSAAKRLGLSRDTLRYRIEKHRLRPLD